MQAEVAQMLLLTSTMLPAGTVFAAELKTSGKAGYGATEAIQVTKDLRSKGIYARPLGNVVYIMVTPTTDPRTCTTLLHHLLSVL